MPPRKPKAPVPLEAEILSQIIMYLRVRGCVVWRQNQGAMPAVNPATGKRRFVRFASADGISDIIGCLPGGRLLAVEVKRPGGKPRPNQQAFLDALRAKGAFAVCVDGVGAMEEALKGIL